MALIQNSGLVSLRLSYNNLRDEGAKILAAGIAQHSSLQSIDLGFNNIGDEGCEALCSAINAPLDTLYLAGNLIRDRGADAIARALEQNTCQLRKLYLTGNHLGPMGVQAICDAISRAELRPSDDGYRRLGVEELYLGGTSMGSAGLQAVVALVRSSRKLRTLSMPNCDISDPAVYTLARSIKDNKCNLALESLQLSFNSISCRGIETLMLALWGYEGIRELLLDNNQIADHGLKQLSMALPSLKGLEILNVGFNSFQSLGAMCLMKAVADQQANLHTISISGCRLDQNAAKSVAYALALNKSIACLDLVHCDIDNEGQRQIVAGAISNSGSRLQELTGFEIAPLVVSLGFPQKLQTWSNTNILRFILCMWEKYRSGNLSADTGVEAKKSMQDMQKAYEDCHSLSHDATIVVSLAKKAFDIFEKEGAGLRSCNKDKKIRAPTSPIAGDSIVVEFSKASLESNNNQNEYSTDLARKPAFKSFVAISEEDKGFSHESLKKFTSDWVGANKNQLKALSWRPFSSADLWRLHQHFFTPVVKESGGDVSPSHSFSVAQVSNNDSSFSQSEMGLASWGDDMSGLPLSLGSAPTMKQLSPVEDTPMLKRKVSYKCIGDSLHQSYTLQGGKTSTDHRVMSASMIIESLPSSTLPPQNKRARRNRSRISFLPKVKERLDSFMEMNHDKALMTMRLLFVVEQAILSGQVLPIDESISHLRGQFAQAAESILIDHFL